MIFLELCQRLRQECGGSGTGPASVTTATGEDLLWVDWINDAWLELQELRPNWSWMWEATTIAVVAGTRTYALESTTIQLDSLRLAGNRLTYLPWHRFQQVHGAGHAQAAMPVAYTIQPDRNLVLSSEPTDDALLELEHYLQPSAMEANGDTPRLPSRYHMILVYDGMRKYGFYDNAPEVLQRGETEYQRMLARLARDTMPAMEASGPLA